MSNFITTLAGSLLSNMGDAGLGVAKGEAEEVLTNLIGSGLKSFPAAVSFLEGISRVPAARRMIVTGLISTLRTNENFLGSDAVPYVRFLNEAIEKVARSAGKAAADLDLGDRSVISQIVDHLNTTGSINTIVHSGVAHRGNGKCTALELAKVVWKADHPDRTVGGGARGASPRTIPGLDFQKIELTLAEAMDQATPCPVCMKQYTVQPAWAKPAEPPKAKTLAESIPEPLRPAYIRLRRMVHAKGPGSLEQLLLQRFTVGTKWELPLLTPILEAAKNDLPGEIRQEVFDDFVAHLDSIVNPSLKDRADALVTEAAHAVVERAKGKGIGAIAGEMLKSSLGVVKGPVAVLVVLIAVFAVGPVIFGIGWLNGSVGMVMTGSFMTIVLAALFLSVQGLADTVGDAFLDGMKALHLRQEGSEENTSLAWLKNLASAMLVLAMIFGLIVEPMVIRPDLRSDLSFLAFALMVLVCLPSAFLLGRESFLGDLVQEMDKKLYTALRKSPLVLIPTGLALAGLLALCDSPVASSWQPLVMVDAANSVVSTTNAVGLPTTVRVDEVFPGAPSGTVGRCATDSLLVCTQFSVAPKLPGFEVQIVPSGTLFAYEIKPTLKSGLVSSVGNLFCLYGNSEAKSGVGFPWWGWFCLAVVFAVAAFTVNYVTRPVQGQPDTKRVLRGILFAALMLAAFGAFATGTVKGVSEGYHAVFDKPVSVASVTTPAPAAPVSISSATATATTSVAKAQSSATTRPTEKWCQENMRTSEGLQACLKKAR